MSTPMNIFLNTWRFCWSRLVLKMIALIESSVLAGPDRKKSFLTYLDTKMEIPIINISSVPETSLKKCK